MKSLLNLAGGGAVVAIWKAIPAIVKVPAIFGLGMLATVELNKDANESWFSGHIFGGQAAQGQAQIDDPAATQKTIKAGQPVTGAAAMMAAQVDGARGEAVQKIAQGDAQAVDPAATQKAIQAGKPVTGAAATLAAQYQGLAADAKQKTVYADAATESEDEILAKKAAGLRITSTEELRLAELRAKRAEMRKQEADAQLAEVRTGYAKGYWQASAALNKRYPSNQSPTDWLLSLTRPTH